MQFKQIIKKLWTPAGILALSLAGAFLILYSVWKNHKAFVQEHKDSIKQDMISTANLIRRDLENFITEHQQDLKVLANTPEIKEQAYKKRKWNNL